MRIIGFLGAAALAMGIGVHLAPDAPIYVVVAITYGAAALGWVLGAIAEGRQK